MLLTRSELNKFLNYNDLSDEKKLLLELSELGDDIYLIKYNTMPEKEKNNLMFYVRKNLRKYNGQEIIDEIDDFVDIARKTIDVSDMLKRMGYFNPYCKNFDEFIEKTKIVSSLKIDENLRRNIFREFKEWNDEFFTTHFFNILNQTYPKDCQLLKKVYNIHYV